jgi:hypothetical protein
MIRPAFFPLAASLLGVVPAQAVQLYDEGDLNIRWDNTLRFSVGTRLEKPSSVILAFPNGDDGDRAFAPGLMTDRVDLLTVLDLTKGDFGAQISVAAWYDTVYHTRNDDRSPTVNAISGGGGKFVRATRDIDGQYAEFSDSFAFANLELAGMPLSLRIGRQTLLWGESLFFSQNSISAAQAPVDYARSTSTPNSYAKSSFLPVNQISFTLQPTNGISLAGYYQLEWRSDRLPGVGSYFSTTDLQGAGAERAFVQGGDLLHSADARPPNSGQYGVSLHASLDEIDLGLYALRFDSKYPVLQLVRDSAGNPTSFHSIYPSGTELYGGSFSAYIGDTAIAGELSVRRNMPLVSLSPISLNLPSPIRGTGLPAYTEGDTFNGLISSVAAMGPTSIWDAADFSSEIELNGLLAATSGRAVLSLGRGSWAAGGRGEFKPHYFEVLPNLDVSLLFGLGFNSAGDPSVDYEQNSGIGDFEIGISATYLSVWKVDLTLTSYLGSPVRQPLSDRNFLLLGLERTI